MSGAALRKVVVGQKYGTVMFALAFRPDGEIKLDDDVGGADGSYTFGPDGKTITIFIDGRRPFRGRVYKAARGATLMALTDNWGCLWRSQAWRGFRPISMHHCTPLVPVPE
jgi:hypothetical protein